MNDLPRRKLAEVITRYGRSLCDDPSRCEGLLRDLCGQHKPEIRLLMGALEQRVAADLLSSQSGPSLAPVMARLTRRMQDELAVTEQAARWAAESWALALGVISAPLPASHASVVGPQSGQAPPPVGSLRPPGPQSDAVMVMRQQPDQPRHEFLTPGPPSDAVMVRVAAIIAALLAFANIVAAIAPASDVPGSTHDALKTVPDVLAAKAAATSKSSATTKQ